MPWRRPNGSSRHRGAAGGAGGGPLHPGSRRRPPWPDRGGAARPATGPARPGGTPGPLPGARAPDPAGGDALAPLARELEQQQHDRQQLEALQRRVAELEAAQAPRPGSWRSCGSGGRTPWPSGSWRSGSAMGCSRPSIRRAARWRPPSCACSGAPSPSRASRRRRGWSRPRPCSSASIGSSASWPLPALASQDMERLRAWSGRGMPPGPAPRRGRRIEVIRASRPVTLAGEPLPEGSSRLLAPSRQPAGGQRRGTAAHSRRRRHRGRGGAAAAGGPAALEQALQRWTLPSVEEAAIAERPPL